MNANLKKNISDKLVDVDYVPSESERKRVILYYFLVGILIALSNKSISKYELFHLKQAMGWWMVFFFVFISSIFLVYLPFIKVIPIIVFMVLFVMWIIFVKQGWEGKTVFNINGENRIIQLFVGIGGWILNVFDVRFKIMGEEK